MSYQAADYVSEELSFGDDEQKLAKTLRVSCWLNGAACSLKLNDFQGAVKLCSRVICQNYKRHLSLEYSWILMSNHCISPFSFTLCTTQSLYLYMLFKFGDSSLSIGFIYL